MPGRSLSAGGMNTTPSGLTAHWVVGPRPGSPPRVRLPPRPRPRLQPHTLGALVNPVPEPSSPLVQEIQPGQILAMTCGSHRTPDRTSAFTGLRPADARQTENPPAATPAQRFVMRCDSCVLFKSLSYHAEIIKPLAFPVPLFSANLAMNSVPPSSNVSFQRKPSCFASLERFT